MDRVSRMRLEVDTSSALNQINQVSREFERVSRGVVTGAASGGAGQDPIRYMEDRIRGVAAGSGSAQIMARRREIDETYEREMAAYRQRYTGSSWNQREFDAIQARRTGAITDMQRESQNNRMVVELLRELVDTTKAQARNEIFEDKAAVVQRIRDYDNGELTINDDEKVKLEYQRSLLRTEDKEPRQWVEVFKGMMASKAVEGLAHFVSHTGTALATMKTEEPVMAHMWRAVPIVGDALAAASERNLELQEGRGIAATKLGARSGLFTQAGVPDRIKLEELESDVFRRSRERKEKLSKDFEDKYGFEAEAGWREKTTMEGGWTATPITFMTPNEANRRAAIRKKSGITGKMSASDKAHDAELEAAKLEYEKQQKAFTEEWSYTGIGFTSEEFLPVAQQLLGEMGTSKTLSSRTKDLLSIEKSRGVERNMLMSMASIGKYSSGGRGGFNLPEVFGRIEDTLTRTGIITDGDRGMQNYALSSITQLAQAQTARGITGVDMAGMSGKYAGLAGLGGRFAYDSSMMTNMDNSLRNPNNEWQTASNYEIYSRLARSKGEEPTYVGFLKWQEKGMSAEGLAEGRMSQIAGLFGGDMATLATKSLFGDLSMEEAEKLAKNPGALSVKASKGGADYADKYRGLATGDYTTHVEKSQAEITEAFTESMAKGLEVAFSKVGESIGRKLAATNIPGAGDLGLWLMNALKSSDHH